MGFARVSQRVTKRTADPTPPFIDASFGAQLISRLTGGSGVDYPGSFDSQTADEGTRDRPVALVAPEANSPLNAPPSVYQLRSNG